MCVPHTLYNERERRVYAETDGRREWREQRAVRLAPAPVTIVGGGDSAPATVL